MLKVSFIKVNQLQVLPRDNLMAYFAPKTNSFFDTYNINDNFMDFLK